MCITHIMSPRPLLFCALLALTVSTAAVFTSSSTLRDDALQFRPLGEPACGGDITAVRINPFNASQLYIAGDMLGVGVSLDGGESFSSPSADSFLSWEAADFSFDPALGRVYVASMSGPYYCNASDPLHWASIRAGFPAVDSAYGSYPAAVQIVLVDPTASGRRLLALGGTKRGWPRAGNLGVVWESTDAGASWRNISRLGGNVVAAEWCGPACLWAAVDGAGMSRSIDSGRTWTLAWPASAPTSLASGGAHPTDPNVAFAATCDGRGVLVTKDAGVTWGAAGAGLPVGGGQCYEAFGVALSDPAVLYAGERGTTDAMFVSRDGGASWTRSGAPPSSQAFSLGLQASFLSVDPSDADTVYYATWVTLWRTRDGGANWTDLTARAPPGDTSGVLWRGTGFGGLVATNAQWSPYNYTPRDGSSGPFPRLFLQGMDAGKIWASTNGSILDTPWRRQSGLNLFGGGNALAFGADGTTVYAGTGQFGWPSAYSTEGVVRSLDGGDSWAYVCGSPPGASAAGSVSVTALCVTPSNTSNLWAIFNDNRLYFSSDGCANWTAISAVNDSVTSLACAAPGDPAATSPNPAHATVYASGWRGVWATGPGWTDALHDWILLPGGPTAWSYSTNWCTLAPIDAPEPRLVCANAWWDQWHSGLWRLNVTAALAAPGVDGWKWTLQGEVTAYRWAAAPGTRGRVQALATNLNPYPEASTASGVWLSVDSGTSWALQMTGLRMRRVSALAWSPDGSLLIAGLNGGGFVAANTTALLQRVEGEGEG